MASLGNGKFFDAAIAGSLRDELEQAIALPFDVLDASGAVVSSGLLGDQGIELPAGFYRVLVKTDSGELLVPDVEIWPDSTRHIRVNRLGDGVEYSIQ